MFYTLLLTDLLDPGDAGEKRRFELEPVPTM